MVLLFHLSDVHLSRDVESQSALLANLVAAVRRERDASPADHAALVVTGDVFDSATDPAERMIETFLSLHERLSDALGGHPPTVILPGNHDRRRMGLIGPHREGLFEALANAVDPRHVHVAGRTTPFLAQVIPRPWHGLDAHLVAYDSSYLPRGLLGAGGTMRSEDLLQVHARLPPDNLPLIVLVHHHLIPTPITDISYVDAVGGSRVIRWLVNTVAPTLVSNADREELTMTAMGAGTALSTLHTFGRPVLLLHGHKHFPTARLLLGMTDGCGDLLIVSAGSAGRRERVQATHDPDAARVWPSFNVVKMEGGVFDIASVSFAPRRTTRPPLRRALARVRCEGPKLSQDHVTFRVKDPESRVAVDAARFTLSPSGARWDIACERRVTLCEGAKLDRYTDFVHALPVIVAGRHAGRFNRRVELELGGVTRFGFPGAVCRTLAEGRRCYGVGAAFEWVGLLCRYGAASARLSLSRRGAADLDPFGSMTDLSTGRERPLNVESSEDGWTVHAEPCPPRGLLRLYWPLVAEGASAHHASVMAADRDTGIESGTGVVTPDSGR
jgi:3',5'-cyclic AMP phosphodiesterase CpdA